MCRVKVGVEFSRERNVDLGIFLKPNNIHGPSIINLVDVRTLAIVFKSISKWSYKLADHVHVVYDLIYIFLCIKRVGGATRNDFSI